MKLTWQVTFGLVVLVFFGVCLWQATAWPRQAKFFPIAILVPMIIVGLVNLALELKGLFTHRRLSTDCTSETAVTEPVGERAAVRLTFQTFLWVFGFFAGIWLVGFSVAIPLFIFSYLKLYSREGWIVSLALAAAVWVFFFLLFETLLHLPLPEGMIFSLW
jgi:hypothetical protein